jgi:uncharacterized membrane protein
MARASRSWLQAAGLAAITGGRTALGPALVCRVLPRTPASRRRATVLAVLELLGDKLPRVPNRTAPIGLAFRIVNGARVVRALRPGRGAVTVAALALGAAAAVAGAFVGLRLRRALTRRLGGGALANAVAGAIEDAGLLLLGSRLARP